MLVTSIGYKQASQQTNIKEATLRQWAKRFNWNSVVPHSQATVTTVTKPSDALRIVLEDDSRTTKLGLSKAARRAAETFQGLTGASVIKRAKQLKEVTGTAAQIHNWEGQHSSSNLDINVLAGGRAMIQVVQGPGAVSE